LNYNGAEIDRHIYAGPLLAPVFQVLPPELSQRLVATASERLVDERMGARTVVPMDFHLDSVIAYYKLAGKEAGEEYFYANGGVWPHCTAWYVLALQSIGRVDDAAAFFRGTMTIDGIARSSMGQPAFYEYRYSNPSSPDFGKIDKPSFLWAGGFYLSVLYRLYAISENEWNLSVPSVRPAHVDSISFTLAFGKPKDVVVRGKGERLAILRVDGREEPSLVLPLDLADSRRIEVEFGELRVPYLERLDAILHRIGYDRGKRTLQCTVSSFDGHRSRVVVISRSRPRSVRLDRREVGEVRSRMESDGAVRTEILFAGSQKNQLLNVVF
jgi:hypothetical protein